MLVAETKRILETSITKSDLDDMLARMHAAPKYQPLETPEFESRELIRQKLKDKYCTYDELLDFAAEQVSWNELIEFENATRKRMSESALMCLNFHREAFEKLNAIHNKAHELSEVELLAVEAAASLEEKIAFFDGGEAREKTAITEKAKFAAAQRHKRTNEAKAEIVKIWSSGKYSSRDRCAEEECAALDLAFSTARKALIGTPEPTSKT